MAGPRCSSSRTSPTRRPGAGELLVDVEAIGVNYRDVYEREGKGAHVAEPPHLAGVEGAGTVAAVGEGVSRFAAGDRVAWSHAPGSYAERVLVSDDAAVALPDGISTEVAAAVMLQGTTAHYLAVSTYPIQAGDTVIVHAAAGGVGLLLTQIAKRRGGRVIATTSTEEKAALARGAGADETIGYDGFGERARELTGGEGVHAVYDGIGATTFDESLAALRPRGFMVLYGAASGPPPAVEIPRLNAPRSSSPARRSSTTARPATSCASAPATSWPGSRPASSTSASAAATRSKTRPARTRTSNLAAPRGS